MFPQPVMHISAMLVFQIHRWAESERTSVFLKEKYGIERIPCCWLLSLLRLIKPQSLNLQQTNKYGLLNFSGHTDIMRTTAFLPT